MVLQVEASSQFEIEAWGATDVGMKRRLNEDVFLVDHEAGIYLVADGMGGHAAGEVASRVAADKIVETFRESPEEESETWPGHWDPGLSADANQMVDSILAGHYEVTQAMEDDAELKGMGTTVVVAYHPPGSNALVICHVGDSRAYRLRGGRLSLLTSDHSWVHEQVAAGFLSDDAARTHPLKNVVTQALGGSSEPKVDILETAMEPADLYLLCSDGLNSMLTDDEIGDIVRQPGTLEEICSRLIFAANQRGGNDNISVVLLRPRSD
jgi:serine/threonine protein phosphatase PrpC